MKTHFSNLLNTPSIIQNLSNFDTTKIDKENIEVFIDSRLLKENSLFIPLVGDNLNAHNYIKDISSENVIIVCNNDFFESHQEIFKKFENYIVVECTLLYLQNLASTHYKRWKNKDEQKFSICITGSNGKTTLKEMCFHLFDKIYPGKVTKTKGNFNNHIGLPLTILDVEDHHKFSIIEIGTNHFGEIETLVNIAKPEIGTITNIGDSHLEFLENRDGVFKEKSTLYRFIENLDSENKLFFINTFDDYLKKLDHGLSWEVKIDTNDKVIKDIKNSDLFAIHNIQNMLLAKTICEKIIPNKTKKILEAIKTFKFPLNRSSWLEKNDKHYFLDAYNANPSSIKASLTEFFSYIEDNSISKRKVLCILGDMNELGEKTEIFHNEISSLIPENVQAIFIGKFSKYYADGFKGNSIECKNVDEFKDKYLKKLEKKFEYYFIKGSRSVMLEKIIE